MELPKRKACRLQGVDYNRAGACFITLCVYHHRCLFEMECVGNGPCAVPPVQNQILHRWLKAAAIEFGVIVDKYVIMPNHLHMIVFIPQEAVSRRNKTERHVGRSLLEDMMQWFKTMTTNEYIRGVKNGILPPFHKKLWQKSYHDHIIRGEQDYKEIWEYIDKNPLKWQEDRSFERL